MRPTTKGVGGGEPPRREAANDPRGVCVGNARPRAHTSGRTIGAGRECWVCDGEGVGVGVVLTAAYSVRAD